MFDKIEVIIFEKKMKKKEVAEKIYRRFIRFGGLTYYLRKEW